MNARIAAKTLPLSAADESFSHQLPTPQLETLYVHPRWGDRCYHQLFVDDLTINAGRQLYPHDGRRFAFLGVATSEVQHCLRAAEAFKPGDDPDQPTIGGVTIEVVRPLEEIRLVVDEPGFPVAMDLTFTGRFDAVAADRHRIEQRGEVVTDYLNFFQSGLYSGTIEVEGKHYDVHERAGFRDRGWGLRKHEASGRRGFMMATWCELPEASIYTLLYETTSGRRAFTNGWLIDASGVADVATGIEHDLQFDGTLLTGGTLDVTWSSGETQSVEIEVKGRNFLSGIGYAIEEQRRAPGIDRFAITEPAVIASLDGQNDNASVFRVDGIEGHGYVETGVGLHARYRPE
jgi:hypothetical protein